VASQYLNDHPAFLETARFWTECYAKPVPGDRLHPDSKPLGSSYYQEQQQPSQPHNQQQQHFQSHQTPSFVMQPAAAPAPVLSKEELEKRRKVQDLVEMGFEADRARTFLIRANWQTEAALEDLLNSQ